MRLATVTAAVSCCGVFFACAPDIGGPVDVGGDSGIDSGPVWDGDAGPMMEPDSGPPDSGVPDSGQPDSGPLSCVIDGQSYLSRALNPANLAECCNPATSPSAWLPLLAPGVVVTTTGGPNDGAVGDFNGDGIADFAVSTSAPQNVYAYFGLPNGAGYSDPFVYEADAWPVDVTVGDMNGDGLADIIVGDGDSVVVLISQGDGGFNAPQVMESSCGWVGPLVIPDVNQDGWNDVVAGTTSCGLVVFTNLGQGDGAVSSATHIGVSGTQVATIDVPTYAPAFAAVAGDLWVTVNDGGESFATDDLVTLPGGGGGVAVESFLGGGVPEIVAELSNSLSLVTVDQATGVGTVLSTSTIDTGGQRIAAMDLNGDGYPDVVSFNGGSLGISINLTDGGFATGVDIPVPLSVNSGYGIQMITGGDLNGDGAPDVLVMVGALGPLNGPVVQYLNSCP